MQPTTKASEPMSCRRGDIDKGAVNPRLTMRINRLGRRKQARWIKAVSHRRSYYNSSRSCSRPQQANSTRALKKKRSEKYSQRAGGCIDIFYEPADVPQIFSGVSMTHSHLDETPKSLQTLLSFYLDPSAIGLPDLWEQGLRGRLGWMSVSKNLQKSLD